MDAQTLATVDGGLFRSLDAFAARGEHLAWRGRLGSRGASGGAQGGGLPTSASGGRPAIVALAFSNLFADGDLAADFNGDGGLDLFDFLVFQDASHLLGGLRPVLLRARSGEDFGDLV